MASASNFVNNYANNVTSFINQLMTMQTLNLQLADDPTLITRYFQDPKARTDIVAADITNASSAITQLLFTFNSGSPTQGSYLFKVTP